MIWTDLIEMHEFERRGWLYPDEVTLVYRTDCDRRTARLERRVELERHRTDAVYFLALRCSIEDDADRRRLSLDELVYGNPRAMHELVDLRVELDRARARVAALTRVLRQAEEWARRIAEDERVEGWVHGQDYGLYLLLADCPVEFGVLYSQPAHATDEAERAAISATPTGEA